MSLFSHRLFFVLSALLLSACSTFSNQLNTPDASSSTLTSSWHAQKDVAEALDSWVLRGRLVLSDGQSKTASSVFWKQIVDQYQIQLAGPVGLGRVKLVGDAQSVQVISSQGKQSFDSLEQAQRAYQLPSIPVHQLNYWVRGLLYPSSAVTDLKQDDDGYPMQFTQDLWHVTLSEYRLINGLKLPSKLAFVKHSSTTQLNVSLNVLSWTIH